MNISGKIAFLSLILLVLPAFTMKRNTDGQVSGPKKPAYLRVMEASQAAMAEQQAANQGAVPTYKNIKAQPRQDLAVARKDRNNDEEVDNVLLLSFVQKAALEMNNNPFIFVSQENGVTTHTDGTWTISSGWNISQLQNK